MKSIILTGTILVFITTLFMACATPGEINENIQPVDIGSISIHQAYESYFPFGFAIGSGHQDLVGDILTLHANRITCENDMKMGPIHPSEEIYNFTNADNLADFALEHEMTMTSHALVWHTQCPEWIFQDQNGQALTPGNTDDIELIKGRMQSHIHTMVERYHGVVDNWDVVNEAISDSHGKTYRDEGEGSDWYHYFQSEDYIYWAFKYAEEALAQIPGSQIDLYYNDYNVVVDQKLEKIMSMVEWLETQGIEVDGIGLQAHWGLTWPSTQQIQETIDAITEAGLKVKISELDISIYSEDDYASGSWEEEREFTGELEELQAQRYEELFELFRANSEHITSVTLWGVSDDLSWLNWHPIQRNNYPLLFDHNHEIKEAYYRVVNF